MKTEIGQRIKSERERKRISQETLAKAVGWNHHQTVSEVEQGRREVKAGELYAIAKFLQLSLDVLLGVEALGAQPYVLWREKPQHNEKLAEASFLSECDNYVFVEKTVSQSEETSLLVFEELPKKKIDLTTFLAEHAYQLAEHVRHLMALGDFPAAQLVGVLEERYGVKFIVENEEMEPAAACSRSEKGCFILLNGQDAESRQYFSIAHELFHLITWDQEMFDLIEEDLHYHEKNEQLANAFAAGLLIPKEKLETECLRICPQKAITAPDVIALAEQFQVSKEAMLYRMQNMGLITEKQVHMIKENLKGLNETKVPRQKIAHFLRSKYVRLVYLAYSHVKISRAKAAKLLHIDLCDLTDVFAQYGFAEVNVF